MANRLALAGSSARTLNIRALRHTERFGSKDAHVVDPLPYPKHSGLSANAAGYGCKSPRYRFTWKPVELVLLVGAGMDVFSNLQICIPPAYRQH